ncbi:threonylcarbamoyl-AMP synthase [Salipaludibacillus keqinensis]|uniref:Threonylcarbamoyl-AMP synthase n=1 Tax=Salipaludibacillus keqinensis TaxID=2045207 RepID=A0A323TSS3_9BACI|nr:L-threonylcarbamoyladenylate synthase [Salipaludibacillus keqinensis]PYZ92485.1 threonylcarbamoyl-AMP synthase [Salipaludibacillus keqinensis]
MTYQQKNYWVVDKTVDNLSSTEEILQAAHHIQQNHVIAFPTETVYGLGGNAQSDEAVNRIFNAKGRPSDNPLIVHISAQEQLEQYVQEIPDQARRLMEAFWPGPLTIVFRHNGTLSTKVTAGLNTVAVRMPDHPVALALIEAADRPIAAPSANRSGRPSPTTATHVHDDLSGRIAGIVDGGPTGIGVESTVVDCSSEQVMILRPGGVTKEALEEVVGQVDVDPALIEINQAPRSPGMKYTHYAPTAPLILVDGDVDYFCEQIIRAQDDGQRVGALITNEYCGMTGANKEVLMGVSTELSTIAQHLYDSLRSFGENEVDVIFAQVFTDSHLGSAIMNRLTKAAGGTVRRQ